MPHLIIAPVARRGIERCYRFLSPKSPQATRRAMTAIREQLHQLTTFPDAGRPVEDEPGMRELLIPFGKAGYVALYRHEPAKDAVFVVGFRHMREAGY